MTVGGVDMLGGLGVVVEDVLEVTSGTDDVTGIVARESAFVVGKISGVKDIRAISCPICVPWRKAS